MKKQIKNSVIITQSYEEVRFLLELVEFIDTSNLLKIIVFGNHDLYNHLNILFSYKNNIEIHKVNSFSLFNLAILNKIQINILMNDFMKYFKGATDVYFLTRLCVTHLVPIIKAAKKINIIPSYVYLPHKKLYYEKDNGEFTGLSSFKIRNKNDFLYFIYYKLFFRKEIELAMVADTRVTVLKKYFLDAYCQTKRNIFNPNDDMLYLENYYKHNYHYLKEEKSKYIVFYDQSYHSRPIVNNELYKKLINEIFKEIEKLHIKVYYKGHPNILLKDLDFIPDYVEFLESYVPSEFTSTYNAIPISITSGSIINIATDSKAISIVHLVPYISTEVYLNSLKAVNSKKIKDNILFPKSISQLIDNINVLINEEITS